MKTFIITVHDNFLSEIDEVANNLIGKGMKVTKIFPEVGTIVGSYKSSNVTKFQNTEGVLNISEEGYYQLPPSNSKLQ